MLLLPLLCTQLQLLCSASLCSPPPLSSPEILHPLHIFPELLPPPPHKQNVHTRDPSQAHSNKVKCFNYKICTKRLGRIFCSEQKLTDATETIPYLAIRATDLPSPSFLFSHFTGRYWFPVLFFLLHVLVGPHLFLIQQAGSLEFTFLPDKLPSQTKKKKKKKKVNYFLFLRMC